MAEEKANALASAKSFFDRFSISQKIFLAATVIIGILGVMIVINAVSAPSYSVLYSNLTAKDSGMVLDELKSRKVPYKVSPGGGVIQVPDDKVAELRIELGAKGLPAGGNVGFEIFDESSISTTDFVQNINYIRAVEGELGRTISGLREVNAAKVHIVMPKRSVFLEEQEEAKASIVLQLRPGAHIGANVVPGILHLTAQAVPGLRTENIAILDSGGKLLSKPKGEGDVFDEMSTTQLSYQKKLEGRLVRRIVTLLEPHVGAGRVRADVRLKLNFDKVETMEETVDPDKVAKISEKTETANSSGGVKGGGVPGVASNVGASGSTAAAAAAPITTESSSEKTMTNYEVSKKVTRLTKPVGDIEKLSVAVVVDDAQEVQFQDDKPVTSTRKRTTEELDTYKKLIQASVGFDTTRGDVIEVANLSFDHTAKRVSDYYYEKEKSKTELLNYGRYLLIFIAVVAGLIILRRLTKKIIEVVKEAKLPRAEEIEIPKVDSDKLAALQEAKDEVEIERELMEKYKVPKSSKKMNIIREKVKEFAQENLDGTASLVKSFLVEE